MHAGSSISSRIFLRHGISINQLRLLHANPPETKMTDLYECSNSSTITIQTNTGDPAKLASMNDSCSKNTSSSSITSTSTSTIDVERHPDLWFEDGSVICRAENTLFCVHMSQLARHSLVFNDMFMLPQASGPEGSMRMGPFMAVSGEAGQSAPSSAGGNNHEVVRTKTTTRTVPVVYLYDAAEDVANLFTALYDGPYVLKFDPYFPDTQFRVAGRSETMTRTTFASSLGSCASQQNTSSILFAPKHLRI
jgi:hypothetical protein